MTPLVWALAALVLAGTVAAGVRRWLARHPPVAAIVPMAAQDSAQLHLMHKGAVEHEIAWHGTDVPGHYSYAGKRYIRHARQGDVWEFRR
jgi:hypothetical protein